MENLRDLTEQTCQRFAVCQKKRHPVVLAPAAAGEKGSTQPRCSCCWSRGSVEHSASCHKAERAKASLAALLPQEIRAKGCSEGMLPANKLSRSDRDVGLRHTQRAPCLLPIS